MDMHKHWSKYFAELGLKHMHDASCAWVLRESGLAGILFELSGV